MYEISKRFTFDAAHQLVGLPDWHKCSRMHGHTYTVEVQLTSDTVDDVGMVMDYGLLAPVKNWLDAHLDHRVLNDVLPDNLTPTAENLARYLHGVVGALLDLPDSVLAAVGVSETPATWAWWRP